MNSRMREHDSDVKQCQVYQNPIEIASTEPSFEERETRSDIDRKREGEGDITKRERDK